MGNIDVWAQICTERMAAQPWGESLRRWTKKAGLPVVPSVEQTLAAMDEADVDIALLSAWYGPQGSLISNEEVAAQIAKAPSRFKGLASVDLNRPMEGVQEIRKWVDKKSFVGVRIMPWLWNLPPNHRLYYPIYAVCAEMGIPVCTQIGHTGPLMRSDVGHPIPYLEDVLLDFPDLKVVGGHVGFPWVNEVASLTPKFPNFYVDTSAYASHRLPPDFIYYMKTIGSGRVMFGTNWPMISPKACLDKLAQLTLTKEQEAAFRFGTAKKVFGI